MLPCVTCRFSLELRVEDFRRRRRLYKPIGCIADKSGECIVVFQRDYVHFTLLIQ
jgi:hypothetical protein